MSYSRDSSPVYYREIQKNAYLKRIPDEANTSKSLGLRPLGLKKAPLKPLWTQLCVHNGKTPYLEQYRDPVSARAHRPVWRASLLTARHVTSSVTARDSQYDFLVDTHDGPVRMLAPDWDTMQDWVTTLRNKLHELKIVPLCENVYCAPPAAPPARAAARDPNSPLPPTPPVPPDRVPGIDLTPIVRNTAPAHQSEPAVEESELPTTQATNCVSSVSRANTSTSAQISSTSSQNTSTITSNISTLMARQNSSSSEHNQSTTVSNYSVVASNTSTTAHNYSTTASNMSVTASNYSPAASNMSMAQDYSLAAPNISFPTLETIDISSWDSTETTEAPFTSLPSTSQVAKSVTKICGQNICLDDSILKRTIESDDDDFLSEDRSSLGSKSGSLGGTSETVGSKDGSNIGSEVNSYKQTMVVSDNQPDEEENGTSDRPSNITVIQVSNKEPPHTAIPVIGSETDVFDFDFKSTHRKPNFVNIVNTEVNVQNSNDYGTVFSKNEPEYGHLSLTTTVSLTGHVKLTDVNVGGHNEGLYEKLCLASTSKESPKASPLPIRRLKNQEKVRKSSLPNLDAINSDSTYEYLFLSPNNNSLGSITSSSGNVPTTTSNVSTITTTAANITTISTTNVTLHSDVNNSRVHINSVAIVDPSARDIRSNIERSNSQNDYDVAPRRETRIEQNSSANKNGKVEKIESVQPKPIWKRGLTELSLLTRLRGIAHSKRHDSPDRQNDRNAVTSPVKVVHRSRPDVRVDRSRRRSSSLSNGQSPPSISISRTLQPLRALQAAALRSEQRRGAALVAPCPTLHPPIFADYNKQVWVAWWGTNGARFSGRAGDRVCGVRGVLPKDAGHARDLVSNAHAPVVDILFHRVPLGKIYVINKRDQESTGIKIDSECNITSVEGESPAGLAGIPPPGKWAVTEANNRHTNLLKADTEDINRLTLRGTEASVLIQPSALVKKLRAALKGNKSLLGLR